VIFVTVGTQLPFDRMVQTIDLWAKDKEEKVFVQLGPKSQEGSFTPNNVEFVDFLPPARVKELCLEADVIVAHAGMGSILTALTYRKPIIVMPRQLKFNEHRNDHQLSTARWMEEVTGVTVAWDSEQLIACLDEFDGDQGEPEISKYAEEKLLDFLSSEINKN